MAEMVGTKYGGLAPVSTWSGQRYEQVQHFKFWIFVAINAIANKVASMTPNVGLITEQEPIPEKYARHERYIRSNYRHRFTKAATPLRGDQDIEPLGLDHALVHLLAHPNQYETAFSVWYQTVMYTRLTGNAYWWVPPSIGFDTPSEIHVIPAHWVTPRCYDPKAGHIVDYYDVRPIAGGGYQAMYFPADEVIHFKYDSPLSKIDGHSQVAAGDRWFDISESIDQSRWNAMKQSINSSGVVELSPDYYDPDDAQINRLQVQFLQHAGERRTGKPIILSPGMKFTPLMVSARELDHHQSAEQIRDMALAMFGVPKAVTGIVDTTTRANHEGSMVSFCSNTINPETKRLGETSTKYLAYRFDPDAVIWFDDASPSDAAQINADLQVDIQAGSITKGEVRQMRGLPLFGDERDDEIAGVPSQPPGGDMGMEGIFDDQGGEMDMAGGDTADNRMVDTSGGEDEQGRFNNSMLEPSLNGEAE